MSHRMLTALAILAFACLSGCATIKQQICQYVPTLPPCVSNPAQ